MGNIAKMLKNHCFRVFFVKDLTTTMILFFANIWYYPRMHAFEKTFFCFAYVFCRNNNALYKFFFFIIFKVLTSSILAEQKNLCFSGPYYIQIHPLFLAIFSLFLGFSNKSLKIIFLWCTTQI